ncbi:hypothetical protein HD554DRAFT_1145974 [Boletus coccyginus]|nr:hypothetical protein HD554DRAFT_1145974 [Boletus coccyginus]
MSTGVIPLDKSALLSTLLEALLYGFSLLMFGGTMWTLLSQRSTRQVNRKMFVAACLLLLISTAHLIIHIIRIMYGLILYRDTYPGGPVAYFSDVSHWPFYVKNLLYTAQTLVGDAVVLYRCYVVWQSRLIMIFPLLLWCATAVTGFMSCVTAENTTNGVDVGTLDRWITSFWAMALAANLLATLLLISRIWFVHREVTKLGASNGGSQLRSILHILVDSGVIYSVTLVVALICFVSESNGHNAVVDMITPIISITFYMVIIRVGLAARVGQTTHVPLGNISIMMDSDLRAERLGRSGMQVHITRLAESKIDHGECSPLGITSLSIDLDEIKFDGKGEV